jgi:hypothetical protein
MLTANRMPPRMTKTTITALLASLLAGACLVVPAVAARKANHAQAVAITKAFKTTPKAGLKKIAYQFDVVKIRISTVESRYARANFVAKKQYRGMFQAGYGVAKRGAHGWKAIDVGSADVGCGKVPPPVRKDLKLTCH